MWLGIAAAVLAMEGQSDAAAAASGWALERTAAWSYVSFQAEGLGSRVTAEVWSADLTIAAEQAGFLKSPRGTAFKPSGRQVVKLSVRIRIDIIGRRPLWLENHVGLDPCDGTPLYLIRTRVGLDDYYQQFRFTQEGVFRRQREPGSAAEAAGPPEFWSKLGEHFYAYPPGEKCVPVLETSTLMYLVSVAPADMLHDLPPLCVFHKRQLHRVSLQNTSAEPIGFDYLEKKGESETRRSGMAQVRKIKIESRPIGSYRGEVEDLFGNGAMLYLSTVGRVPVMISGEMTLIGRVDLKLSEVRYN
ncbi:MAG: hypothetical protein EHM37_01825 [Deltaproteobacteria bacterium]|nr:MAG: hypothetical protein EHM37_01825 [Deltaproteobacteria bacterium]